MSGTSWINDKLDDLVDASRLSLGYGSGRKVICVTARIMGFIARLKMGEKAMRDEWEGRNKRVLVAILASTVPALRGTRADTAPRSVCQLGSG